MRRAVTLGEAPLSDFDLPLAVRLLGGFREPMDRLPLRPLGRLLGVRLNPLRDERTGEALGHQPEPPETGTASILLEPNEAPDGSLGDPARPDLESLLRIDLRGASFLDPGRLDWSLRARYGDLFDIREYAVFSQLHADTPAHWVAFSRSPGNAAAPAAGSPELACTLRLDLPSRRAEAASAALASEDGADLRLERQVAARRTRLTLTFDTRSLLTLGRLAEIARLAAGRTARVLGYTIDGDLTRNGRPTRVGHTLQEPRERGASRPDRSPRSGE